MGSLDKSSFDEEIGYLVVLVTLDPKRSFHSEIAKF
jgi:hypothetical protein